MTDIHFYSASKQYGEFSNFFLRPVLIDGHVWPSNEHYYQAQKHNDLEYREQIRSADSPKLAAELGRNPARTVRKNWDATKVEVMRKALFEKFSQHPDLLKLLLSTHSARILEASSKDSFWGIGKDHRGKNMLGLLLMEVRERLKARDCNITAIESG